MKARRRAGMINQLQLQTPLEGPTWKDAGKQLLPLNRCTLNHLIFTVTLISHRDFQFSITSLAGGDEV